MKKYINYIYAIAAFSAVSAGAQTYDFTWSPASDSDYKWNNESNWTPNGLPTSESSVYFEITGSNIKLENDVYLKDVVWGMTTANQLTFTGGTINAENFTTKINLKDYSQFCFGSLNVQKSDGTGKLLFSSFDTKVNYQVVEYLLNANVYADNAEIAVRNSWSGGTNVSFGWNGGGSEANPRFLVRNEFKIGTDSAFTTDRANSYAQFGGITGSGTIAAKGTGTLKIKLTGGNISEYTSSAATSIAAGASIELTVDSTATQKFTNSAFNVSKTVVKNGALEIAGNAGAVELLGGEISSIKNLSAGDVLAMSSLSWSGGKIALNLGDGTCDSISIAGDFTTSGTGGLVFSFTFDDIVISDALEASADGKLVFDIVSATGSTTLGNTNFVFQDQAYGKYAYLFDGSKLTMTLAGTVPEPATVAAILGVLALAFAVIRRRR